jgi:hypothetical protein
MHVLGFMDVDERVTGQYLIDMSVLVTFKLNTGKHGEALVSNTLLEVVVSFDVRLSRISASSRHDYSFLGDTIHQVRQEAVGIMWVIMVELSSELVFNVCDVNEVSVSDEIGLTPFLRKYAVKDVAEGLHLFAIFFIFVTDKVSNKGLVVR